MGSLCTFNPFPWRKTSTWQNCGCSRILRKYLDRLQGLNGISNYCHHFHCILVSILLASRPPAALLPGCLPEIPALGPPSMALNGTQGPVSVTAHGPGNWFVLAQWVPQSIRFLLWSNAGRHKIATETRHFFIFNVAFLAHLTYNETTLQEGIYSVNYCCQSKANHAVNSTVTQMTNNFKGKENQDFAAYSVLFQETDKGLHILVLSVLHLL